MRLLTLALLATSASAHTIFQRLRVNGADQGQLVAVRAPSTNNPVTDVSGSSITCNTGLLSPVSSAVVTIPAGASVGAWWQHIIGGPQGTGDADNPIASSHKGPVQVYLASVASGTAGTAGYTGLKWFKIASDGLSGGKWGVDNMIAASGWSTFTLPSCIAAGDYLLRVEIIALHNAYSSGGAQFYMSCANIRVTGSGTFTGSGFVSLPGAYTASDPGILINIYDAQGAPTNGGKAYTAPGGAVQTCPAGSNTGGATTTTTTSAAGGGATTTSRTTTTTTTTAAGGANCAAKYGQCGGSGWTGATCCTGSTCTTSNAYYSQCL